MTGADFAKAAGLGIVLMALNLALLFALGAVYAGFVEPGRDEAYYATVYPRLGAWSAPVGVTVLMLLATWVSGRRRPQRDPLRFGVAAYVSYFVVDTILGLASGPPSSLIGIPFVAGLIGGLAGVVAGAKLAARR